MTAVASPPSQHSLSRWHSAKDGGETIESMTAEEVHRLLIAPKREQTQSDSGYSNGSSSLEQPVEFSPIPPSASAEQGGWGPKKKAAKFWPSSKIDTVPGMPTAGNQPINTPSSGQAAASTANSLQQQSSLPSQQNHAQTNGARSEYTAAQRNDPTVILELHPLTGTFERKRIVIPCYPDVQKIGRQTNQKTIPAANNGYFDSKVLSRQHAEVWAEKGGKVLIRDVKSSNGTFVNGTRLSQESKESEPHELREGDVLELGIDIVSEDQKSIVHHKVSAKVERAGLYSNSLSMLDMMHLDPNTGQPMLSDATGGQLSQMRGRGSQGAIGNNNHMSGPGNMAGNLNPLGAHRQMNMWMEPITVEKVVKRLTAELRQAKQQSHELHRTGDFFTTLLNLEPGQEPPKSPRKESAEKQQSQGAAAAPAETSLSFSKPPAPPPSQPLPEKPNSAPYGMADSLVQSGIKRVETEKPANVHGSPTRSEPQNSQILALLDALKSAKQELNSQGDRMKCLENALKRERNAREKAERRAQALSGDPSIEIRHDVDGEVDEEAFEPPLDSVELMEQDLPNGHVDGQEDHESNRLITSASTETLKDPDLYQSEPDTNEATSLQDRYELLKQEFDQAKSMMESYKRRAEEAEQSQRRFAELLENIRGGNRDHNINSPPSVTSTDSTLFGSDIADDASSKNSSQHHDGLTRGLWSPPQKHNQQQIANGNILPPGTKIPPELEASLVRVLEQQQRKGGPGEGKWEQSAPYVSMVGVVLIGVGIMTWLNGWQPGGGRVVE